MAKMNDEQGGMTVQEAGRKGGKTTSQTHGHEFYQKIGQMGGTRTSETHGKEFYQEIGKKGGSKVRELINEGKEAMR